MPWKTLGWFALPVLVVLVFGIVVARLVEKDDLTRQIALFAAVVAGGGLLVNYAKAVYDVWDKERERKKKENENKESIRATPEFRNYNTSAIIVGVELYNSGKTSVNIKKVAIVIKIGNEKIKQQLTARNPNKKNDPTALIHDIKLEPKDVASFFNFGTDKRFGGAELLTVNPDDLWLSIEPYSGDSVKVSGSKIQEVIESRLKILRKRQ